MFSGDVGGGGSAMDYQAGGLLGYKIKPTIALQLGWRYLYDRYHGNHQFIWDVHESGPMLGATFEFGGRPPAPPAASCSVSPTAIWSGDPVTATISTQYFNPKHTLTYKWSSTGGKISGPGTTGNVDTAGLAPGSYSVYGNGHRRKREEEQHSELQCSVHREAAAAPGGKLLGQSDHDCHRPAGNHHHDRHGPAGMADDL